MDDIRELERQTQLALQKKMGDGSVGDEDDGKWKIVHPDGKGKIPFKLVANLDPSISEAEQASKHSKQMSSIEKTDETPMFPKKLPPPLLKQQPPSAESSDADDDEFVDNSLRTDRSDSNQLSRTARHGSKGALHSPIGSTHSFDLQVRISIPFLMDYFMEVILGFCLFIFKIFFHLFVTFMCVRLRTPCTFSLIYFVFSSLYFHKQSACQK